MYEFYLKKKQLVITMGEKSWGGGKLWKKVGDQVFEDRDLRDLVSIQ